MDALRHCSESPTPNRNVPYEQLGNDLGVGDDFVGEGIFSAVVGEREAGMVEAESV